MSKKMRIIVTVFGGWFGLHKFLDKKIGMGILYFFTAGLFLIGWIYDCKKAFSLPDTPKINLSNADLIRWQNLTFHSDRTDLFVTVPQLEEASQMLIDDASRILHDSLKLIQETTTPEVYFKRLNLVIECYNDLADLEEFYHTGFDPVTELQNFDEHKLTYQFIQRFWYKVISESEKLKTDSGKEAKKEKAKNSLLKFSDEIDALNINYIKELA